MRGYVARGLLFANAPYSPRVAAPRFQLEASVSADLFALQTPGKSRSLMRVPSRSYCETSEDGTVSPGKRSRLRNLIAEVSLRDPL